MRRSHVVAVLGFACLAAAALAACEAASDGDATPTRARATATRTVFVPTASPIPLTPCGPPYPSGPAFCIDPARAEGAVVVRIIDGDTFEADIDGRRETVRFFGIDTPERGQPCFREATARAAELLGGSALLVPDERERDRYGRVLRYVYTAGGASIDAALVREGYAAAWRDDGALRAELLELESEARAGERGCLWGAAG